MVGFGILVFYMFIEASRPIQDNSIRPQQKDDLIKSWLIQAFPIMNMFNHFMSAYRKSTDSDFKLKKVAGKLERVVKHNELDEVTIIESSRALQEMYPKEWHSDPTLRHTR